MEIILLLILAAIIYYLVKKYSNNLNKSLALNEHEPNGQKFCVVVDTETNGLLADRKLNVSKANLDSFPKIVEFSWGVFTKDGKIVTEGDYLIQQTTKIPDKAKNVHGITDEECKNEGKELTEVLKKFSQDVEGCRIVVGHNVMFDKKIIEAEFLRCNIPKPFKYFKKYDTMTIGKKNLGVTKYPKLTELHKRVLSSNLANVKNHRAIVDVKMTAQLFFYFYWTDSLS